MGTHDRNFNLYASNNDLLNGTNALKTGVSDANGEVTFTGLSAIKYYFMAQTGCENNFVNGDSTVSPLILNTTSSALATIEGAGILKFANTSTNPYTIYIDGSPVFVLNGLSTFTSPSIFPIGTYNLEVIQNSGYVLYPTDEKFSGNLACGGSLTTTFP